MLDFSNEIIYINHQFLSLVEPYLPPPSPHSLFDWLFGCFKIYSVVYLYIRTHTDIKLDHRS
jgi:hypothetical protein